MIIKGNTTFPSLAIIINERVYPLSLSLSVELRVIEKEADGDLCICTCDEKQEKRLSLIQ